MSMTTGEVAKALGVHYNTAYNLASKGEVQVPKGDNGQYQWSEESLAKAREVQAAKARSGRSRKPATSLRSEVKVSSKQDQAVLDLIARVKGVSAQEVLHDLIAQEAEALRAEVNSVLG